ncbi:MAG: glutamine--fructose-6-phosphate aminotransferase [Candidatus Staskawiczbacteria bacterium RIFCSPHIGHO2_02_FULL_43_16]|uniref:Glutamine--fructose-6-phosphate aminotransferase [isomerizing] n=1 Tax=Candidatus Staskawiczbacteria bacterium RIFCSPHIGHO2_01_FULL_41_41 TaxID=1802203 RepID=A0A1G2HUD6_9BACT|nr:MAG: glutamine--fructose-6-phosphate aminotransferase [Candidatus Staskawiczbacteria bacterium RIFCSPHIGHO2_01_FULL_41_41]OGZ69065.1 MAG: glutamine--fructose-6-phosphate aminotransferase [Candidatus Staskawiczbacteria bacterium RIFCSPHIGHO2_02_FULL_43_16]OGZ74508.1 MAG: glutamine--fructose-6-phosphate aminotransferase [Candidatus Staskawiczbacteria bacterium RIFCSPLOWO2_01_FULL_43_17b]
MCGIIGYIGKQQALPILIDGLKKLEYRGYDSAGFAVHSGEGVVVKKAVGQVANLEKAILDSSFQILDSNIGIAHTRWATHGVPNEVNSHPHTDCKQRVFVAHNGIIENYKELKHYLQERGHTFTSATDTEVVAHLIEDFINQGDDFEKALKLALNMLRGAYAFAIIDAENSAVLYAAKCQSPLVIGLGQQEHFLASDPSALITHTKNAVYLNDFEMAKISAGEITIENIRREPTDTKVVTLEWNLEQAQKGNYQHFMQKEIFEGPETVKLAFAGRLHEAGVKLGGLEQVKEKLETIKRVIICACGTSYYAGLVGEYLFEEIAGIPVETHFASEFRYRQEPFEPGTAAIFISQSGETADTLGALRKAKENGLLTLGIVNVVGSTIARETDAGVYNHAGPEIGVASTKAFLSQITVLALMAEYLAKVKRPGLLEELRNIPGKIGAILARASEIEKLAEKYLYHKNFIFLGRRYNYPTALEGALKLKEISYLHAEGYGAGELKHGPIAMIGKEFPTIALVPGNGVLEKMYSNLEEIKARSGPILAIATEGDQHISAIASDVFYIPATLEPLEPLLTVVPLQLLAYYIGAKLGYNVDKPRNLAKSVTVE